MSLRKCRNALTLESLEARLLLNASDLDVVFAGTGKLTTSFPGSAQLNDLAAQPDGKIVALGQAGSNLALARYLRNGSLDPAFNGTGMVTASASAAPNGTGEAVAVAPDGSLYVAGFAGPAKGQQFALWKFLPTGALDTRFGNGGVVLTSISVSATAQTLLVTPSGQIVVAGSEQIIAGDAASDFAVARYSADGTLDAGFGNGGLVTTHFGDFSAGINVLALDAAGNILAAGHTSVSSGFFNFALARYQPNGTLDASFGTNGTVTTPFGQFDDLSALALQADGKIVAAGSFSTGSKVELALARYLSNGNLDVTIGSAGQVKLDLGGSNQAAHGVRAQTDGKLLVGGIYAPSGPSEFFLARLNADGSLDPTFGTSGVTLTTFDPTVNTGVQSLIQLSDGTLVAGGTSNGQFALARYLGEPAPPDVPLPAPNAVFLNRVYETVLGRPVDAGGLAHWEDQLMAGLSRTQVVATIENSPEYRAHVVDQLYQRLLGRPADPGGEQLFANALANGATVEDVEAAMYGSAEYFQRAGSTTAGFLNRLYRDTLGRALDSTGNQTWTTALAGGVPRGAVAALVLASTEAIQDVVTGYYTQYLDRSADPGGLAVWVGQRQQGTRDEAIQAGFLGSGEFFNLL
jgi:uncharacterized delta-60 repeat protein